jgi:hypothetical protein
MSETLDFRKWAARVAGQASKERNPGEAQRLRSIAGYWERLADIEDRQGEGFARQRPRRASGLPRVVQGLSRPVVAGDLSGEGAQQVGRIAHDQGDHIDRQCQGTTQVNTKRRKTIGHWGRPW